MIEILKPQVDYFEPLKNLHKREYPLPKRELKAIIESTMEGLIHTNKRLDKMKKTGNLTEEERVHADSFYFYCRKLVENKVSPISVNVDFNVIDGVNYKDGRMVVEHSYNSDIADMNFSGFAGWNDTNTLPKLNSNNFWQWFKFIKFRDEKALKTDIKNDLIDEYENYLVEKFRKDEILKGDISCAQDKYKSYLFWINRYFKQGRIKKKPSEDEMKKTQIKFTQKNSLRYLDLKGNEIYPDKTKHEAWESFKQENPILLQRLIQLCNKPLVSKIGINKELEHEFSLSINKALVLLRVKGFSMYPDLTA